MFTSNQPLHLRETLPASKTKDPATRTKPSPNSTTHQRTTTQLLETMDSAKQAADSVVDGVKKMAIGGPKKEKKEKKKGGQAADGPQRALELNPPADFLQHRIDM